MIRRLRNKISSEEAGFSILETLISLALSMFIFAITTVQFGHISKLNRDMKIKEAADRYARTVVNLIGFDMRIIGNGIPFDQNQFQIGYTGLSGPASDGVSRIDPIVLSSLSNSYIMMRLSESGDMYVLNQNFNPSATTDIYLSEVANLELDDRIYITNGAVGGNQGYYGRILDIDDDLNMITIASDEYTYSTGATFLTGSLLFKVSNISYSNSGGNIVRTVDSKPAMVLSPNSNFSLRFLDYEGEEIELASSPALAITRDDLRNRLATVEVTVNVNGRARLTEDKNGDGAGDVYTATSRQIFSLRNLNIIQSN